MYAKLRRNIFFENLMTSNDRSLIDNDKEPSDE